MPKYSILRKFFVVVVFALLQMNTNAQAQQGSGNSQDSAEDLIRQMSALNWQKTSTNVSVASVAHIVVPSGYGVLTPPDSAKFMELNHNPSSGKEYILMPYSGAWFAVLGYEDTGHIKDNDSLDSDNLLLQQKEGTELSNDERRKRGWGTLSVVGWAFKPEYNKESHRLEWAFLDKDDSSGQKVVNYNTRILGRTGVMDVVLVADPNRLDASVSELNSALNSFSFNSGQRYAEYKPGDKTAEYGLAALIAGGAAAVAAKKGVFAGLLAALAAGWKFVLAGLVAFFAFIGKVLRKLGLKS